MQRHLHDSNLEENKAVLDVIRRRVEAFRRSLRVRRILGRVRARGLLSAARQGSACRLQFRAAARRRCGRRSARIWKPWRAYPDHWPAIAFSNHDVIRTASALRRGFGQGDAGAAVRACAARCCSIRARNWACRKSISGATSCAIRWAISIIRCSRAATAAARPCPGMRRRPIWVSRAGTPWLPLGPAHAALAVAAQERDPGIHPGVRPPDAEGAQGRMQACARPIWHCWRRRCRCSRSAAARFSASSIWAGRAMNWTLPHAITALPEFRHRRGRARRRPAEPGAA